MYYLSDLICIGNLGVVPLFLLCAFLFAPAFFNLLARLPSVTFDLETIVKLLSANTFLFIKYNHAFLYSIRRYVKTNTFRVASTATLAISACYLLPVTYAEDFSKNIIISKGEHHEIILKNMRKFTIGNHEIISHKLIENRKKLIIKGKKLGFTELILWESKSQKRILRIYVLSKREHLKIVHVAKSLHSLDVNADISGPLISIVGKIENIQQYNLIYKFFKLYPSIINLQASLSKKLRNNIIAQVYKFSYEEYNDTISCSESNFLILCSFDKSIPIGLELSKFLHNNYLIQFIPINQNKKSKNFLIKLKIIQIEKSNGEEFSLGLDGISTDLKDLFSEGPKALFNKNKLSLQKRSLLFTTIAEPQTVALINEQTEIEVGSNIPFTTNSKDGVNVTTWKFAGLKIDLKISPHNNRYLLSYKTEFTRPINGKNLMISGNKEKSSALIGLNRPITLFEIGFQTNGSDKNQMPIISNIPILGAIFQSHSGHRSYKKITGVLYMEEYEL